MPAGEPGEGVQQAEAVFGGGGQVERMAQNCSAPVRVRRQPETFCRILIIRISRSAALLSNGTRASMVNRR